MSIKFYCADIPNQSKALEIAKKLSTTLEFDNTKRNESEPYFLFRDLNLYFFHPLAKAKNPLLINYDSPKNQWRMSRVEHEKHLKKAIGRHNRPLRIFDTTGGLLTDALIFLSLGHFVERTEKSSIIYNLTNYALEKSTTVKKKLKKKFIHHNVDFKEINQHDSYDIVYYDPMFEATKKTASSSGNIDYLKKILEFENHRYDTKLDFQYLCDNFKCKKIIKRPVKATPLSKKINYQIFGKSIRYDVYL